MIRAGRDAGIGGGPRILAHRLDGEAEGGAAHDEPDDGHGEQRQQHAEMQLLGARAGWETAASARIGGEVG